MSKIQNHSSTRRLFALSVPPDVAPKLRLLILRPTVVLRSERLEVMLKNRGKEEGENSQLGRQIKQEDRLTNLVEEVTRNFISDED